ncbi:hypothetical protein PanWU01x14_215700, partial [Parasponia andersonii]
KEMFHSILGLNSAKKKGNILLIGTFCKLLNVKKHSQMLIIEGNLASQNNCSIKTHNGTGAEIFSLFSPFAYTKSESFFFFLNAARPKLGLERRLFETKLLS